MQVVPNRESFEQQNDRNCTITVFDTDTKKIDFVLADIYNRYPETGWYCNTECEEIAHVLDGGGEIELAGHEPTRIHRGDTIHIAAGEKFAWKPVQNDSLTLSISCSPAWSEEQYAYFKDVS